MKSDPCKVCGGTDVNLVDGYYYCIECGTQDENVRETVVEKVFTADGTFAHNFTKRVVKTHIQMSKQWHKWHTFNFILSGLADEMVALGASSTFKAKLLWIWTRYVRKYQKKDDTDNSDFLSQTEKNKLLDDLMIESDASDKDNQEEADEQDVKVSHRHNIKKISMTVLYAMIYAALNLDNSHIQLSHMTKFIREGRLGGADCIKYIPKEMKVEWIPEWHSFAKSRHRALTSYRLRCVTMNLFNILDLGMPNIPNITQIVECFIKELCLPNDFKDIVFSLMHAIPWKMWLLKRNRKCHDVPNFEGVAMAYIVIALKICFGLDDEYDISVSEAVEKINDSNNSAKAYKFDMFQDETDRLFSFHEWANYLQLRKIVLSTFHYPFSIQYNKGVDDLVFLSQTKGRYKQEVASNISDDVTMKILSKITSDSDVFDNINAEFPATLTPHCDHIDIIASHVTDPDLKLLLSEDFTKYSLKYATTKFKLKVDKKNIIVGVNEIGKLQEDEIEGTFDILGHFDRTMVYVRNCENKNWLITKPPTSDHITKLDDNESAKDKDSDHGYDSNSELSKNIDIKLEINHDEYNYDLEEEAEGKNIFDDDTLIIDTKTSISIEFDNDVSVNNNTKYEPNNENTLNDNVDCVINSNTEEYPQFDPKSFDRDEAIKQLIIIACRKHRIPLPTEYKTPIERKRRAEKNKTSTDECSEPKLKKKAERNKNTVNVEINKLIEAYHKKVYEDMVEERGLHDLQNNLENLIVQSTSKTMLQNQSCNETTLLDDTQTEISAINQPEDVTNINHDLTDNIGDNDVSVQSQGDEDEEIVDNPNFDEKNYDVKQLYIKYKETELEDVPLEIDNELDLILTKATRNGEDVNPEKDSIEDNHEKDDTEIRKCVQKCSERNNNLNKGHHKRKLKKFNKPLIHSQNVYEFGYWIRHYKGCLSRNYLATRQFDLEVLENYPRSFNFILSICAAISECSMLDLYTNLIKLEQELLKLQ